MVQSMNQFKQRAEKGQVDLNHLGQVLTARVGSAQATALVPGQAVQLADVAGKQLDVVAVADATTKVHGVVLRNLQKSEFGTLESCEIAVNGSVVFMEASEAIAKGGKVAYSATGEKVAPAIATNVVLGVALDKALADGDLIRVMVAPLAVEETL